MPPAATTWWWPQTRRCTRRNDWAEIESPWSNGLGPQEDTLPHPELNLTQAFKDLVQIGITLTSEHDLDILLERSEEHTSELQSLAYLVCRLLLEKKKKKSKISTYCQKI